MKFFFLENSFGVMKFTIMLYIALLVFIETKSKELYHESQVNIEAKSSSEDPHQLTHEQYAINKVAVYITPSDVNSLQNEDKATNPSLLAKSELSKQNITQKEITFEEREHIFGEKFENSQGARVTVLVERPDYKNFEKNSRNPIVATENLSNKNIHKTHDIDPQTSLTFEDKTQELIDIPRSVWMLLQPILREKQSSQGEVLTQQSNRMLELKTMPILAPQNHLPIQIENPPLQLQSAPKNNGKNNIDNMKLLRKYQNEELGKHSASTHMGAPILFHQEVTITKHHPNTPILKLVRVPVSEPLPVHIPEPFGVNIPGPFEVNVPLPYEVNIPHPYPVPFEILQHTPIVLKKRTPLDVHKQILVREIKKVNHNRHYDIHKKVPVTNHAPIKIIRDT